MERKGDRTAHLGTLFIFIKDAVKDKNKNMVQFTAGYYACLHNEGYMTEEEHKTMIELFKALEMSVGAGLNSSTLDALMFSIIDKCEKLILKGGEQK